MTAENIGALIVAIIALLGVVYQVSSNQRSARHAKEAEAAAILAKQETEFNRNNLEFTRGQVEMLLEHYRTSVRETSEHYQVEYNKRIALEAKLDAAFREIDALKIEIARLVKELNRGTN